MQIAGILTIIIGFQLLVTHFVALELYLYWKFWWLDILMHLLGGVWLVSIWRTLTDMELIPFRWWRLRIILPVTITLMIIWEIFGVYVEDGFKVGYITDTVGDIVCGIVGVMVGFWLLRKLQILDTSHTNYEK
jgi:hypothetical protein